MNIICAGGAEFFRGDLAGGGVSSAPEDILEALAASCLSGARLHPMVGTELGFMGDGDGALDRLALVTWAAVGISFAFVGDATSLSSTCD